MDTDAGYRSVRLRMCTYVRSRLMHVDPICCTRTQMHGTVADTSRVPKIYQFQKRELLFKRCSTIHDTQNMKMSMKKNKETNGPDSQHFVFWDCVPKSLVVVAVCSLSFANELCPETLGGWSSRNSDEAVISRLRSDFFFL